MPPHGVHLQTGLEEVASPATKEEIAKIPSSCSTTSLALVLNSGPRKSMPGRLFRGPVFEMYFLGEDSISDGSNPTTAI